MTLDPAMKGHNRDRGVDLAEVSDEGTGPDTGNRNGRHWLVHDAGAHGSQMRPGGGARRADDVGRRPRRGVESRTIPADWLVGTVDVLLVVDEITFEVTLRWS